MSPDLPHCRQILFHLSHQGRLLQNRLCRITGPWDSKKTCSQNYPLWTLLQPHGLKPIRLLCPWDFPGKNTGVSCHTILQGIFLTQGLYPHNLCLLHCRQILYLCATWEACVFLYRHMFKCTKTLPFSPPNYTFQTHKHMACKCIHNIFQNATLNCYEM